MLDSAISQQLVLTTMWVSRMTSTLTPLLGTGQYSMATPVGIHPPSRQAHSAFINLCRWAEQPCHSTLWFRGCWSAHFGHITHLRNAAAGPLLPWRSGVTSHHAPDYTGKRSMFYQSCTCAITPSYQYRNTWYTTELSLYTISWYPQHRSL